ncbi:MAG: hypothetical protein JWM89_354 [Acidimicrobiales bacterium]|nr:hypothetical protein [Acidimicrobiales bacterium]
MHAPVSDVPIEMQAGGIETRGDTWGDLTVRHIQLPAGTDFTPLFVGLPDDLCQCAHWGTVTEGSITVRYADGTEETTRAGELYYWPGGHTGWTDEGVTFVEFSPAAAIAPVLAHLASQVAAG